MNQNRAEIFKSELRKDTVPFRGYMCVELNLYYQFKGYKITGAEYTGNL